ncbi:hypothetical protein BGW36DRAFT_384743 [Talaromyces proteolyticus]|uniref:Zn(2)-C6 fungal-type domain-containing protein n=1 Tax=Talaromyces proteolyticus TaxID=1131652 RepID=A0AAD4KKE3_9EURO|nr:uncharacterized protein BGW36DRAFT_384743 [Talaromyces proteolyticus]KAH8694320.1 hypothetical protein BGW36DRAFT_384743 [Talaromyces proteolyticus]
MHLRTACDPCSKAKVRCDKTHPSCGRCLQMKLHCCYSASRKHGEQLWRKRISQKRHKTAGRVALPLATIEATTTSTATVPPVQGVTWDESLLTLTPTQLTGNQDWNSPLENYGQQEPTALLPSWLAGDGLGTDMDIGNCANWDMTNLAPTASPQNNNLSTQGPSRGDATSEESRSAGTQNIISSATTNSTHDCEARAISILSSLQHGELCEGLTTCSTDPTRVFADLDFTPGFDRVLAVNKAALSDWASLMKCSCAQCPHLTLLYMSILCKILFWYRIAAMEKVPSALADVKESHSTPSSGDNTMEHSSGERSMFEKFGVEPTTVQVGVLNLDPEDQASLRRVLLLRDLRRTEKAIHELMEVDRKVIEEKADESVRGIVKVSLAGIPQISKQLQDVIQVVKEIQ